MKPGKLPLLNVLKRSSRAARLAMGLCATLLSLAIVAWLVFQFDSARVPWTDYMTLGRCGALLSWLTLTTVATYYAARLWFDEVPVRSPDIESAWQAGVVALAQAGLSLRDLPVFLHLGCAHSHTQRQLVSGGKTILVDAPANSSSPLHWYATEEAIYLFCNSAGLFAATQQLLSNSTFQQEAILEREVVLQSAATIQGQQVATLTTNSSNLSSSSSSSSSASFAAAAGATNAGAVATLTPPAATATDRAPAVAVSQQLDELQSLVEQELGGATADRALQVSSAEAGLFQLNPLTSTQVNNSQQILADVCTRLRGARRPVAPLNGIAVVIEAPVVTRSLHAAGLCGQALRSDLEQLNRQLGLAAPVSFVVSGVEQQLGVTEAIRRMGSARAHKWLVGTPCDPRAVLPPHASELLVDAAVSSVAQLVYRLLNEPQVLTRPGNAHLMSWMMECRQQLAKPLKRLLTHALPSNTTSSAASFVNGLFIAACGTRPTEQGFAAPICERMAAQQHWLNWTPAELRVQRRQRWLVRSLMTVSAVELAWLAWQLLP